MCTAFHGASRDVCTLSRNSHGGLQRLMLTQPVSQLSSLAALFHWTNDPECAQLVYVTVRCIVGKAVMSIVRHDVQEAAGPLQLCTGQQAGCEAAVHALRTLFDDVSNDGLLLVDASNAFNSLSRALALVNIRKICPIISPILTNTHQAGAELFVMGEVIHSMGGGGAPREIPSPWPCLPSPWYLCFVQFPPAAHHKCDLETMLQLAVASWPFVCGGTPWRYKVHFTDIFPMHGRRGWL